MENKLNLFQVVGMCFICGNLLNNKKAIQIIYEESLYGDIVFEYPIAWVCSKECEDTFKIEDMFNPK